MPSNSYDLVERILALYDRDVALVENLPEGEALDRNTAAKLNDTLKMVLAVEKAQRDAAKTTQAEIAKMTDAELKKLLAEDAEDE